VKVKSLLFVAAGFLMSGLSAYAHHSFTATYDEEKTVKIEGTLVQFMFRNPHAWVHVMAPDENGDDVSITSFAGGPVLLKFFRGHW